VQTTAGVKGARESNGERRRRRNGVRGKEEEEGGGLCKKKNKIDIAHEEKRKGKASVSASTES